MGALGTKDKKENQDSANELDEQQKAATLKDEQADVKITQSVKSKEEKELETSRKAIQALEEDLGLDDDAEFITDDFVNVGMRDTMKENQLEETGDIDVDFTALQTMVNEIESSSELP